MSSPRPHAGHRPVERVNEALIAKIQRLPDELKRSLTWDQGKVLAEHRAFAVATGVQVYACDPRSPWQRGSNENTKGLPRQYLPKNMDLKPIPQEQLDTIAAQLNSRRRRTPDGTTPAQALSAMVATIPRDHAQFVQGKGHAYLSRARDDLKGGGASVDDRERVEEREPAPNAGANWGATGLVFVGCMLVGGGMGYALGSQQAGWLIGMGASFIGMAITRLRVR